MTQTTIWKDEHVERLTALWKFGGWPASVIAMMMNEEFGLRLTRNAVLGKAHRLGLLGQDRPMKAEMVKARYSRIVPAVKKKAKAVKVVPIAPIAPIAPLPPTPADDRVRVTLADLEQHHCRWPVGDPKEAGFGFCGLSRVLGAPYCADHMRRATEPPRVKAGPVRYVRGGTKRAGLVTVINPQTLEET